uniref:Uncharacterized protein n=1 Tax=Candidatus Methanogaster sp. ANME-2c ERB4 TaxID=2759911 RepID=A0A7G9YGA3_9EURY|nr:hypothetical protein LBHKAHFG_00018 [Methanosarcinales archaeon ANME-2c ERB4]
MFSNRPGEIKNSYFSIYLSERLKMGFTILFEGDVI